MWSTRSPIGQWGRESAFGVTNWPIVQRQLLIPDRNFSCRQEGIIIVADHRMLSKEEAYVQLGHSASLLTAIFEYVK